MKNIVVNISNTAEKFFAKHNDIYNKFIENIKSIYYNDNHNVDIKAMKNYNNIYRMRIQKYRVIYKLINGEIIIIDILAAGSRGDIYKYFTNK